MRRLYQYCIIVACATKNTVSPPISSHEASSGSSYWAITRSRSAKAATVNSPATIRLLTVATRAMRRASSSSSGSMIVMSRRIEAMVMAIAVREP